MQTSCCQQFLSRVTIASTCVCVCVADRQCCLYQLQMERRVGSEATFIAAHVRIMGLIRGYRGRPKNWNSFVRLRTSSITD